MPDQATMDIFAPIWAERDAKYAREQAEREAEEQRIREAIRQGRIAARAEADRIEAERKAKELITFIGVDEPRHIRPGTAAMVESRENGVVSERDRRRAANRAYLRSRVLVREAKAQAQAKFNHYGS